LDPAVPHAESDRTPSPFAEAGDGLAATVLVGGEHPVARAGLCHMLAGQLKCRIVGEAGDALRLLDLARQHTPDLTVVELPPRVAAGAEGRSTRTGWLQLVPALRDEIPGGRILLVSTHASPAMCADCALAGAHGFVHLTDTAVTDLRIAAEAVLAGNEWFHYDVDVETAHSSRDTSSEVTLTRRERQVLVHVADGKTSRQIALLLGISPRTVEAHRESITRKLGVSSVAGLTRYVLQHDVKGD